MITVWEFLWPIPIMAFGYAVWEPNMLTFLFPVLLILVGNYVDSLSQRWAQTDAYSATQLKNSINGKRWHVKDDPSKKDDNKGLVPQSDSSRLSSVHSSKGQQMYIAENSNAIDYYCGQHRHLRPGEVSFADPHNPETDDGVPIAASLVDSPSTAFMVFKTKRCWRSFKAVPLPKDVYRVGSDVFVKQGKVFVEAKDFVCACALCKYKGRGGPGVCVPWHS